MTFLRQFMMSNRSAVLLQYIIFRHSFSLRVLLVLTEPTESNC